MSPAIITIFFSRKYTIQPAGENEWQYEVHTIIFAVFETGSIVTNMFISILNQIQKPNSPIL